MALVNTGTIRLTARRLLQLLLPVLMPSWRFFDSIGPAPRIDYAVFDEGDAAPRQWRPLALAPLRLSLGSMLVRLPYNAPRNDMLFLISCCERVLDDEQALDVRARAHTEILRHVAMHAHQTSAIGPHDDATIRLSFRIRQVRREHNALIEEVAYEAGSFTQSQLMAWDR